VRNKVADRSQKLFRLIHERHVPTVGQDDELRAGDPFVHLLRHSWIALVVIAHDDQRGNPDLRKQISQTRQVFREPFEVYANGRLQTIEGTDFSFGIGTRPGGTGGFPESPKKSETARNEPPEWLRKIIGTGGPGRVW